MAVTQKINRAALDIFILLVLFYAPAFRISCVETQLTLCGSITEILRRRPRRKASRIFQQQRQNLSNSAIKGNRSVTSAARPLGSLHGGVGRGAAVGCGRGIGVIRGVGVGLGVAVGDGVMVGVGVGLA